MPALGFVVRQLEPAQLMRAADQRHLMPTRNQRPRELIGARAARAPRGREMLMEVEEAHETQSVED